MEAQVRGSCETVGRSLCATGFATRLRHWRFARHADLRSYNVFAPTFRRAANFLSIGRNVMPLSIGRSSCERGSLGRATSAALCLNSSMQACCADTMKVTGSTTAIAAGSATWFTPLWAMRDDYDLRQARRYGHNIRRNSTSRPDRCSRTASFGLKPGNDRTIWTIIAPASGREIEKRGPHRLQRFRLAAQFVGARQGERFHISARTASIRP